MLKDTNKMLKDTKINDTISSIFEEEEITRSKFYNFDCIILYAYIDHQAA